MLSLHAGSSRASQSIDDFPYAHLRCLLVTVPTELIEARKQILDLRTLYLIVEDFGRGMGSSWSSDTKTQIKEKIDVIGESILDGPDTPPSLENTVRNAVMSMISRKSDPDGSTYHALFQEIDAAIQLLKSYDPDTIPQQMMKDLREKRGRYYTKANSWVANTSKWLTG